MRKALFLDRDGIINHDDGYTYRRDGFVFIDGIFDLAATATRAGFMLVVVTNQSGIGRGLYTEADFHTLMAWVAGEFAARGAPLARIEFCPDHPTAGLGPYRRESARRKPGPGMLQDAATALTLDLPSSIIVGDKASDAEAGRRAGVGTLVLVSDDPTEQRQAPPGTLAMPSVAAVAAWLQRLG